MIQDASNPLCLASHASIFGVHMCSLDLSHTHSWHFGGAVLCKCKRSCWKTTTHTLMKTWSFSVTHLIQVDPVSTCSRTWGRPKASPATLRCDNPAVESDQRLPFCFHSGPWNCVNKTCGKAHPLFHVPHQYVPRRRLWPLRVQAARLGPSQYNGGSYSGHQILSAAKRMGWGGLFYFVSHPFLVQGK